MKDHGRTHQNFPSRQYAYHGRAEAAFAAPSAILAGKTLRFILGQDAQPLEIPIEGGRAGLHDHMAQLVLFNWELLPLSLRALLAQLDHSNTDPNRGLPV